MLKFGPLPENKNDFIMDYIFFFFFFEKEINRSEVNQDIFVYDSKFSGILILLKLISGGS